MLWAFMAPHKTIYLVFSTGPTGPTRPTRPTQRSNSNKKISLSCILRNFSVYTWNVVAESRGPITYGLPTQRSSFSIQNAVLPFVSTYFDLPPFSFFFFAVLPSRIWLLSTITRWCDEKFGERESRFFFLSRIFTTRKRRTSWIT